MAVVPKQLMARAGNLLRRRAHSRGELAGKLLKLADPPQVEAVLDRLEEVNLLNDGEYAYNFALYRLKETGWGPDRVRHALLQRQVASDHIESALDKVREEYGEGPLLESYLARYCAKNALPSDRKGIRRLLLHLRRRGFTQEIIYRTLRRKIAATAWDSFESGE